MKKRTIIDGNQIREVLTEPRKRVLPRDEKGEPATEATLQEFAHDYKDGTKAIVMPAEVKHAFQNYRLMRDYLKQGKAEDYVKYDQGKNGPALIVGSGPSTDDLKGIVQNWEGAILASTSQAVTIKRYGFRGRLLIAALDPLTDVQEINRIDTWQDTDAVLVSWPGMSPKIHEYWDSLNKKSYYFRAMQPDTPFLAEVLPLAYGDLITAYCLLFSCTPAAQLGLARLGGYDPLFMVGCDFGFPNNKTRFTEWYYENKKWVEKKPGPLSNIKDAILSNNGLPTQAMHIFYKRCMLCVARIDLMDVIDASNGIMTEFPKADIKDIIAKQGKGFEHLYYTKQKKKDIIEKYLATQRTYVLEFEDNKCRIVESDDYKTLMPMFLAQMGNSLKRAGQDPSKIIDVDRIMKRLFEVSGDDIGTYILEKDRIKKQEAVLKISS